jgi:hypothetical protein
MWALTFRRDKGGYRPGATMPRACSSYVSFKSGAQPPISLKKPPAIRGLWHCLLATRLSQNRVRKFPVSRLGKRHKTGAGLWELHLGWFARVRIIPVKSLITGNLLERAVRSTLRCAPVSLAMPPQSASPSLSARQRLRKGPGHAGPLQNSTKSSYCVPERHRLP